MKSREKPAVNDAELSMDARVLVSTWFAWGEKTSVKIGGKGAQSVLSDRAEAAMRELVEKGYVEAMLFNNYGRMEYVGTEKCRDSRLSAAKMTKYGRWSATKPNPEIAKPA